jgi:beta-glucosidase
MPERVELALRAMTPEEKLGQLGSYWSADRSGAANIAPKQNRFDDGRSYDEVSAHGLGHLTRVFGSAPLEPMAGARTLANLQRALGRVLQG